MDRTKILDRIRKLRARTVDRGASEAEMAASLALAQRLMMRYCLSEDDVDATGRDERRGELVARVVFTGPRMCPEAAYISGVVTEFFRGHCLSARRPGRVEVQVVALPRDIDVAAFVWTMLSETYGRLWQRFRQQLPPKRRVMPGVRHSYYEGLTQGLFAKLLEDRRRCQRRRERAGQAASTDLAVRANKAQLARQVKDQFRVHRTERQPPRPVHLAVALAGQIDGQAIAIGKPLEGRTEMAESPLFAGENALQKNLTGSRELP